MRFYLKDPQSRLDYAIDWAPHLGGQTIVASDWLVAPDEAGGIAVAESGFEAGQTAARLTGGTNGHSYAVSNQVTLSNGAIDVRSITLRVEAR